jgi:2-hydroxychromene-2-carboxylate isomerase
MRWNLRAELPYSRGIAQKFAHRNSGGPPMPKKLEFFYDCSSPWTYLAFSKIEDVAARHSADLVWRPFLVGGVFNTVNPSVYETRTNPVKPKARYYVKDL